MKAIDCHVQKYPFVAFGAKYEIRVISDGTDVEVRAFKNDQPVNRLRYTTTLKQAIKMQTATGVDLIDQLVRLAKEHLESPIGLN
jgi:hypothetical protein